MRPALLLAGAGLVILVASQTFLAVRENNDDEERGGVGKKERRESAGSNGFNSWAGDVPWTSREESSEVTEVAHDDWDFLDRLPEAYQGGEVLEGDETVYEDGSVMIRCVLDPGGGQERALVIATRPGSGEGEQSVIHSAERMSVYVHEGHLPSLTAALVGAGFDFQLSRYGATTLDIDLPAKHRGFFQSVQALEQIVAGRGEIFLKVPIPFSLTD